LRRKSRNTACEEKETKRDTRLKNPPRGGGEKNSRKRIKERGLGVRRTATGRGDTGMSQFDWTKGWKKEGTKVRQHNKKGKGRKRPEWTLLTRSAVKKKERGLQCEKGLSLCG